MSKSKDAEYKKRGYILPLTISPEDNISVCVPIPNDPNHIRAFLGQLDMLGYWWTWERDNAKKGTLAAAVWRGIVDAVRERIDNGEDCGMNDCCVDTTVVLHQVNPITGKLEISTDGGVIWTQDPADVGVSAVQMPPPVTSGAATDKCNAAANAVGSIQDWVAEITAKKTEGVNLLEFVTAVALAIIAVFLELATLGTATALIIPICFAVAKLVYQMDNAAWEAYWTTEVYDKLTCIFFCNLEEDGSLSPDNYGRLLIDVILGIPSGVPQDALLNMLKIRGIVGINNMTTIGTGTADCSDCDCPGCQHFYDFTDPDVGYIGVGVTEGTLVTGEGVEITHPRPPSGDFHATVVFVFSEPCDARYIEVTMHFTTGSALQSFDIATSVDENGQLVWVNGGGSWNASNGDSTSGAMIFTPDAAPVPRLALRLNLYDGGYQTGGAFLKTVELRNTP